MERLSRAARISAMAGNRRADIYRDGESTQEQQLRAQEMAVLARDGAEHCMTENEAWRYKTTPGHEVKPLADVIRDDDLRRKFRAGEVQDIAASAGELVCDALDLGERDRDLIGIVVNAIRVRLGEPGADLDTVLKQSYPTFTPGEIRSWWSNWD